MFMGRLAIAVVVWNCENSAVGTSRIILPTALRSSNGVKTLSFPLMENAPGCEYHLLDVGFGKWVQ